MTMIDTSEQVRQQQQNKFITPEITSQVQGLFSTSALIGVYLWAGNPDDIHSWLISKLQMFVGTREIITGFWHRTPFLRFKEAVEGPFPNLTMKVSGAIEMGSVKLPALETLATTPSVFPHKKQALPVAVAPNDLAFGFDLENIDAPGETDLDLIDIYDRKWAETAVENCPIYRLHNGESAVDLGSIHRLACIVTAAESDPPPPPETLRRVMGLIFLWPGICAHQLLDKVKVRDGRAYMLLAYYYAGVIKMKHINMPLTSDFEEEWWQPRAMEMAKAWWLTKNPGVLLRGIIEWLGDEWAEWLEWPTKILEDEEEMERKRLEDIWQPIWDDSAGFF
ncbi:hypothetical protein ABW19_dt0208546 [Dactylella cylindrospora]|nr:hypothetical protein ABW19_dt0208546 [Dactylella cylindrospora]